MNCDGFLFSDSIRSFDQMRKLAHHRQSHHHLAASFELERYASLFTTYFRIASHFLCHRCQHTTRCHNVQCIKLLSCNDFTFDPLRDRARFFSYRRFSFFFRKQNNSRYVFCAPHRFPGCHRYGSPTVPSRPSMGGSVDFSVSFYFHRINTKINYYYCPY